MYLITVFWIDEISVEKCSLIKFSELICEWNSGLDKHQIHIHKFKVEYAFTLW